MFLFLAHYNLCKKSPWRLKRLHIRKSIFTGREQKNQMESAQWLLALKDLKDNKPWNLTQTLEFDSDLDDSDRVIKCMSHLLSFVLSLDYFV